MVFVKIEYRVRDRLALKKERGKISFCLLKKISSNSNESNSSERYEIFVKTLSSKEAEISRQMNRSQKLKRKKTCKRHIQPHRYHPGDPGL